MSAQEPNKECSASKRDFFREQRDKHLEQWMAVSGRVSFGAIALLASVWISMEKLPRISLESLSYIGTALFASAFLLILAGVVLLIWASVSISRFHTKQIERLQCKMAAPDATSVQHEDCRIIVPESRWPMHPHRAVLFGLIALGLGTLLLACVHYTASNLKAGADAAASSSAKT